MASDVEGADVWSDLCKALEAHEPFNINELLGLWDRDLHFWQSAVVSLEELKGWWSKVQSSSSSRTRISLKLEEWQYLMDILICADVSGIEHLLVVFDDNPNVTYGDITCAFHQLGSALSRRDFSKLKTILVIAKNVGLKVFWESGSPGDAIRRAGFAGFDGFASIKNLPFETIALNALADGSCMLSQLTSFDVRLRNSRDVSLLDTIFRSGRFKSLQRFALRYGTVDGGLWEVFMKAVKSQNLPSLVHLEFHNLDRGIVNLAGLFRESREWFGSLETLFIWNNITSEQVCSLVEAVMEDSTQLALKNLRFPDNGLGNQVVKALARLAESHRLQQLQELDLQRTRGDGKSLVPLVQSIGKGRVPSLRRLSWSNNDLSEADAKSVVSAYYADHSLTAEIIGIRWHRYTDPSLETKLKMARDRNLRLAALRRAMREKLGEDIGNFVPLTRAKAFLCGYPKVGKTTLRRALVRPLDIRTKLKRETRPVKEPRTRGIEISKIEMKSEGKNITLFLWDLAGHEEYHVLHGAFLRDLGLEGGKATAFVLVFEAPFGIDVEEKLGYWLRFVASSSRRLVKRHVVIVLNCFNGTDCTEGDQRSWKAEIRNFAKKFNDLLDIHLDPFILDARIAARVQPLKTHLVNHAKTLLQDVGVPRICFEVAEELKRWSIGRDNNQLPILTWQAFEESWMSKRNDLSVTALKCAASYLHEIGEIIFLEKRLSNSMSVNKTILVPNPEWFCRRVVGDLLLPKEMLEGGSSIKVGIDGCISLYIFEDFFQDLLVGGIQSDDIISMLELLGLCFRRGGQKIIVPALICEDDYKSIGWEGKGFHEVMGRCLAAKDTDKNIIPVSLFRRLQVDLAQDLDFGGREDSDYKAGKSFLHFKYGQLLVLIQFDVNHSDPMDDRIDILIKSAMSGDPTEVRSAQVQCICDIMQKVEDLCAVCCNGLAYDIKVIEPSSAANHSPHNMSQRKLMSLKQISDLLVKGKEYLSWQLVDGQNVKTESVLSKIEIGKLVGTAEREYDACRQDAITMGLLPKDFLHENERLEEESNYTAVMGEVQSSDGNDQQHLTTKILYDALKRQGAKIATVVHKDGQRTRQHIDKSSTEILMDFRRGHELLIKHIVAQQSFSSAEKGRSVPRYMYLLKNQDESVVDKVTGAFRYTYQMHFLCESHFDHGFVHQVEPQEGIELKKTKKWLVKVSPWLRRSLQVALMVGTAVGNLYLPGVFSLTPGFSMRSSLEGSATVVERALKMLLDEHKGIDQSVDDDGNCGTPGKAIKVDERRIAQGMVTELIKDLGHDVFAEKTGLREVVLRATDVGSSEQAHYSIAWICDDCYTKYKSNKGRHAHLM